MLKKQKLNIVYCKIKEIKNGMIRLVQLVLIFTANTSVDGKFDNFLRVANLQIILYLRIHNIFSADPSCVLGVATSACACPSRVVKLLACSTWTVALVILTRSCCTGGTGITGDVSLVEDLIGAGASARVSPESSSWLNQGSRATVAGPV